METKQKIIEAALYALKTGGHKNFSQKKVANSLSISPGNLTYYFPNRHALVEAMVEKWYLDWKHELKNLISRMEPSGLNIGDFIDWVMEGAVEEDNARVFRELWAMANTEPQIADLLKSLYAAAVEDVTNKFFMQNPNIHLEEIRGLLYVLACVSEGSAAVFGGDRAQENEINAVKDIVRALLEPAFKVALEGGKIRAVESK